MDKLKDDESEDVRRSVANNLNDISKDNPDIALDIAEKTYAPGTHHIAIIVNGEEKSKLSFDLL